MDRKKSLTDLANDEGTDKGTVGPVPSWPGHNYTDVYEAYLAHQRDAPITFLEIGLGVDGPNWRAHIAKGRNASGGASLKMWYRYFPNATILGIDVNPASFLDNDRIQTGTADQGDPTQLKEFLRARGISKLDVIIDDGSHRPDHQQITLATLFQYLSPGGMYFVEDLLNNGLNDGVSNRYSSSDVLNTRTVLRSFAEDGVFPKPNALGDTRAIEDMIGDLSFHCPRPISTSPRLVRMRRAITRLSTRPAAMRMAGMVEEPLLCALRRRR